MTASIDAATLPHWISARDGLKLFVRCYGATGSKLPPVLCLAGLTRNSRDFHDLAMALSRGPEPRTVYAIDSRGRGLSEHDRDWRNYTVVTEAQDVIDVSIALGIHGASVIGTSRGGILSMVLAAAMPGLLGAVVLNDIGPVIERDGLARIAGYVGRMPLPANWPDAARQIGDMSRGHFPHVPMTQWEEAARAWFNEKDGRPAPGYDPSIGRAVAATGTKIPPFWPQFEGLGGVPVLVVRGANSDILSADTVAEMARRHPNCAALTVAAQGHAPLLKDAATIGAIARFLSAADARETVAGRDFNGRVH